MTSGEARRELLQRDKADWTVGFVHDVDCDRDAPPMSKVVAAADHYVQHLGLKKADALHLARVALRPWVGILVTSDKRFLTKAKGAGLDNVEILSVLEAESALNIQPGEKPPIAPLPGTPLSRSHPWWIPSRAPEP